MLIGIYLYHAAVQNDDASDPIGGIGIVFDSEPEFKAILDDFIPKQSDGTPITGSFACFIDLNDTVISVTDNPLSICNGKKFSESRVGAGLLSKQEGVFDINLNQQSYIVACKHSKGYREYKTVDGYQNDIYCYVFVES